jgi:hypothetical protein
MRPPKITEHPGAGKIREQSLDEYLSVLAADHLAREELSEIRAMALTGMKAINELVDANKKIRELESRIADLSASTQPMIPLGPPNIIKDDAPAPRGGMGLMTQTHHTKAQCPYCDRQITTIPGPWASHMHNKHMDKPFLHPNENPPAG